MDGIIHKAVLYRSNTNHIHAMGEVYGSRFPDGHDIITSRITKAWFSGDDKAMIIQTRNSTYALPLNTILSSSEDIHTAIKEIDEEFGG